MDSIVNGTDEQDDVHTRTAMAVQNLPESEITPDLRRAAKAANCGILYGTDGNQYVRRLDLKRFALGFYFPSPGLAEVVTRKREYLTSLSKIWLMESLQQAIDYIEDKRQVEMREMRLKYEKRLP